MGYAVVPSRHARTRPRGSILTAELLLLLPLLLALVIAILEIGGLLAGRQQLQSACREAARAAAQGGSPDEVAGVVRVALGGRLPDRVEVTLIAPGPGSRPARSGDPVRVALSAPVRELGFGWSSILGIGDREIVVQTTMRRE